MLLPVVGGTAERFRAVLTTLVNQASLGLTHVQLCADADTDVDTRVQSLRQVVDDAPCPHDIQFLAPLVWCGPGRTGALEDVLLHALARAQAERAHVVDAFIRSDPPPMRPSRSKARAWAHLAKYSNAGGRGAWLRGIWQEPEVRGALMARLGELPGWSAFVDLAG